MAFYGDWPRASSVSRRQSFSSAGQLGFGYNDQYHPGGGFNDQFIDGGYQEPFPQQYNQVFPPPGQMHQPFVAPAYGDSPLSDTYYPADERLRTRSTGAYSQAPALITAPAMTPFPSQYSKRGRRSSMSSMYAPAPMQLDGYRHAGGIPIKFRIKNSSRSGVSVHEIMSNMRLSGSHDYTFRDMKVDHRGRLMLKIRWNGYRSLMYEIPVSGHDGGYVNIQSFSRRVARAVVHFLAANAIQIPWDRVLIHRLEETAFGTWQPVLSTI